MTKELNFNEDQQNILLREAAIVNLLAAVTVELYDTLKHGELPEDLCKELTLTWFRVYTHAGVEVMATDE